MTHWLCWLVLGLGAFVYPCMVVDDSLAVLACFRIRSLCLSMNGDG